MAMYPSFDDTTILAVPLQKPTVRKVLIVDDDELVRESLAELVAKAGFDVSTAHDGTTALEVLQKDFAPIVILDRNMPRMDGLALCRAIREARFPGYVYILLLTIHDAEDDILAGLDAGADDYLSKRISPAQLIARMRTAERVLSLEYALKTALDGRQQLAMTDALTGLYNRRYFTKHANRELAQLQRVGGEISLLMVDIDHFKRVNDSYGHGVGDEVIKAFSKTIADALERKTDWIARLGGEEFAVVLSNTDNVGATAVAERIRLAIQNRSVETARGRLSITASMGVATWHIAVGTTSPLSIAELLEEADGALYESKQQGRNRVTAARTAMSGRHASGAKR